MWSVFPNKLFHFRKALSRSSLGISKLPVSPLLHSGTTTKKVTESTCWDADTVELITEIAIKQQAGSRCDMDTQWMKRRLTSQARQNRMADFITILRKMHDLFISEIFQLIIWDHS